MDAAIEFCCGMEKYGNDLLITFGFMDNAAYILRFPINILEELDKEEIDKEELDKEEQKLDIVLQGQYNEYTDKLASHYKQLHFINNVIISCWETDKKEVLQDRVKFVRNAMLDDPGTGNRNLQIKSSYTIKYNEEQLGINKR